MFKSIKIASFFTVSLTGAFLIFMGVIVARGAWTEPGGNPPTGNIAAPINVGNDVQTKSAGLILDAGSVPTPSGLGIFNGGSLDLSGIIKIVDGGGHFISEGSAGQVLARTASGMAWQDQTALPPACTIIGETTAGQKLAKEVDVPADCIDHVCSLVLATTHLNTSNIVDLHATTYVQWKATSFPNPAYNSLTDRWTKPGYGKDGVASDCADTSAGNGINGSTNGCNLILKDSDNLKLMDDYVKSGNAFSDPETDPQNQWTLYDNEANNGLELLVCG